MEEERARSIERAHGQIRTTKIQRREEAYVIVDVVKRAIETGTPEDRIIGIVNDLLTIFLHNAVEDERKAREPNREERTTDSSSAPEAR